MVGEGGLVISVATPRAACEEDIGGGGGLRDPTSEGDWNSILAVWSNGDTAKY